jgi:Mg-chelatase subunit ChlD/predicted enzyme related to lactoylglutathione lyase
MSLLLPLGLAALLLAVPIVVLHMLTPRRPPTSVSSLLHWDGLKHAITAAEPWQKLRWSLLLILQLTAVALFALALARPAVLEPAELAEHTVFIVDASASMSAIDGDPDRLASAVTEAKRLRAELPDQGMASLVVASPRSTILVSQSDDPDEFARAADTVRTSGGGADFEAAFSLAESLVVPERETDFVLLSDGQLSEQEQRLAPLGTRFVPVGSTDTNRAITDLSVTSGPGGMQTRVTVESTGGPDAVQTLRFDVDGITVLSEQIEIPGGGVVEGAFELPTGTRVAVFLDGEDLMAFDNQRYASAPVLGSLRARVHGESRFFIDQLLGALPDVDFDVAPGDEVDFEIYAGVPVPPQPTIPFIAIDAPGGAPGVTPVGRIENPIPTLRANHPLLDDIDVSRIAIAEAQALEVTNGEVVLGAPGAPLVVEGDAAGVPFYYFAFTLEQSNLPIDIAYPILGARMVGGLATSEGVAEPLTVGEPLPVGASGATVTDPRGQTTTLSASDSAPVAAMAGFWTVTRQGSDPVDIAVNTDPAESDLAPRETLPEIRPTPDDQPLVDATTTIARSLLPWVLAALFLVLAFELYVSSRARGVPSRQWRIGLVVRAVIVALLVLAIVNPPFIRSSNDVTTVFVVDVSESMGEAGQESARAWVDSALTEAGDSRWAVVEFGSDARVGTPLGTEPYRRARGVDPEATNMARGLRLAESILTGDTRQRIVLVSDGRVNSGDLQAELERLETFGVAVDVHTVSASTVTDAAISAVDMPSSVNAGEVFQVAVEVLSTISGEATVELAHEDSAVGTQQVSLVPGTNQAVFEVEAGESGLHQYTARVRMTGDAVPQNDTHRAGLEVRGATSVMIVEGEDDGGLILEEALTARGLEVERVPIAQMPGLQELSIHRSVVLVDVSARDMSDERFSTLETFVRDLGRGMVVIGGTHSYGLGGYRDTPLEGLLPVDSDAPDTQREAEVAEVLLIDTSESMGACHCTDRGMFAEEGGVNKTDISKAAATRAIEALGSGDEVGLLAFSGTAEWVIPLQEFPDRATIDQGIGSLRPSGETRIVPAMDVAAAELLASDKELKHIILFTDGFTTELDLGEDFGGGPFTANLLEKVEEIADLGITVSVVGTGEGATPALEEVAAAGNGRFYPGRDLNEIPEIFVQEARLASRSFINEGQFFPVVTSTAEAVRDLASSPAILGYVATTPKPTSEIQLQIGEMGDPLLAAWRIGLGRVTAWTSDGGDRWASGWAGWDGFSDFWSTVVRDTFPLSGSEGQRLDAKISDEVMSVTLEGAEEWPAGTEPIARISYPDGTSEELRLDRISAHEFGAATAARQGGTYAIGVRVDSPDGESVVLSTLATRSFAAEFLPGDADTALMATISTRTGGRGQIEASQAFAPEGLTPGVTESHLRWWFLLAAALLWPVDVALRRLRLSRREQPDPPDPSRSHPPRPTSPEAARTH